MPSLVCLCIFKYIIFFFFLAICNVTFCFSNNSTDYFYIFFSISGNSIYKGMENMHYCVPDPIKVFFICHLMLFFNHNNLWKIKEAQGY